MPMCTVNALTEPYCQLTRNGRFPLTLSEQAAEISENSLTKCCTR